jgi:hypothetical protein
MLLQATSMSGTFNVRSFYNVLIPHDNNPFPWNSVWRNKASMRMAFFTGTASVGRTLTMNNIKK